MATKNIKKRHKTPRCVLLYWNKVKPFEPKRECFMIPVNYFPFYKLIEF